MRKLTLQEYADENKIHINTARIRFNKWLIDWAARDKFKKIVIYEYRTQEEIDIAECNRIFYNQMQEDARIQKEIDDLQNTNQTQPIQPLSPLPPTPPEKTPEQIEKERMIREIQETQMVRPDRISKKEPKVIIPSTLEWEALKDENVRRCRELVIPYTKTFNALSKECWWTQESLSQYIDEFERTKWKITVSDFIDILVEGNKEFEEFVEREFCSHPDTPPEEQPIEQSKLRAIIDLAESHHLDHDLVRYFFEKTEFPALQGDDIILAFLRQYPAKDLQTYANDIQYPMPVV